WCSLDVAKAECTRAVNMPPSRSRRPPFELLQQHGRIIRLRQHADESCVFQPLRELTAVARGNDDRGNEQALLSQCLAPLEPRRGREAQVQYQYVRHGRL